MSIIKVLQQIIDYVLTKLNPDYQSEEVTYDNLTQYKEACLLLFSNTLKAVENQIKIKQQYDALLEDHAILQDKFDNIEAQKCELENKRGNQKDGLAEHNEKLTDRIGFLKDALTLKDKELEDLSKQQQNTTLNFEKEFNEQQINSFLDGQNLSFDFIEDQKLQRSEEKLKVKNLQKSVLSLTSNAKLDQDRIQKILQMNKDLLLGQQILEKENQKLIDEIDDLENNEEKMAKQLKVMKKEVNKHQRKSKENSQSILDIQYLKSVFLQFIDKLLLKPKEALQTLRVLLSLLGHPDKKSQELISLYQKKAKKKGFFFIVILMIQ